jgi:membrane protein DedA with SNARE-associated domain
MMEELFAWLQHSQGPLAYLVLAAAAMIEYVVPPLPGDTIALFGVVLAAGSGYGLGWVYLALNVGSLAGGMMAYGFGRLIGERRIRKPPRFLRSQQVRRAIDAVLVRFERHGSIYLVVNRFLPAMRSVFFVAAGMARLPAWKVVLWGTLSAALWNAIILAAGYYLGANYTQLEQWVRTYSYVAIALGIAVIAFWIWRARRSNGA